jgi:hypothetical protein
VTVEQTSYVKDKIRPEISQPALASSGPAKGYADAGAGIRTRSNARPPDSGRMLNCLSKIAITPNGPPFASRTQP